MSDTTAFTPPADTPAVPSYGEDDEAKSLIKNTTPPAPPPGAAPEAAGTTETDIERNRAEAEARAAAKPG